MTSTTVPPDASRSLVVSPMGREPGCDDDVERDEGALVPIGDELARIAFEEKLWDARRDLAHQQLGTNAAKTEPLFASASGLITIEVPRTDWLVRGLLTAKSVAMIGGEPKSTKTWCGLEILLSVATGTKAFGEFPACSPRHVAALLPEDGIASLRNRLFGLATGRHMPLETATAHIHYRCLTAIDVRRDEHQALLVASLRSLPEPPAVVLLDPLRDIIGNADENSASEMSAVLHAFRSLRNVTGATFLVVHHSSKSTADTKTRRGGQKLRGSSAIHGALDCGIYLGNTRGNLETTWRNDVTAEIKGARSAGVFGLELDVVDDDEGAAKVAGWRYERDPKQLDPDAANGPPKLGTKPTKGAELALYELRKEFWMSRRAGRELRPISSNTMATQLNKPKSTVADWLKSLADRGLADIHPTGFTLKQQFEEESED